MNLNPTQRRELLALARQSIQEGVTQVGHTPCPDVPSELIPPLLRSTFVTLHVDGELRGCCGTLNAQRPLAEDVWSNAWASAFADPRFPPLTAAEFERIDLHISVLSEPEPVRVADEAELLRTVRPGVDGLVLEMGPAQSTFLPSVWEQLPDPEQFVRHLKLKAGWSADFWSPRIQVLRYTTESFGEGEPSLYE